MSDMANPANHSILLDNQIIVDGVLMQEKKDLTKTLNDETGVEESYFRHNNSTLKKSTQKITMSAKTSRTF